MLKFKKNKLFLPLLIFLTIFATIFNFYTTTADAAGAFTKYTAPDGRVYKLYVPSGYKSSPLPLVVMLHGCTQDPDQFAAGTDMNVLGEDNNFLVAYPEQPSSANQNKCWNWFQTAHQSRGSGEPKSINGVVNDIEGNYKVDTDKVYVTGLSAGAAMSVIMGATYPDTFAAIGVGSGLEYKAASSTSSAYSAMSGGGPDPDQQGKLAYEAMGEHKRIVPTIVFQGTSDYTVYPINGDQVLSQWAQTNDLAYNGTDDNVISDTPSTTENADANGRTFTKYSYVNPSGQVIMAKYMIDGMGHAWSGGNTAGSYTDAKGPKESKVMWEFFKEHPMKGANDTTAPTTTANPAGGTYSESVSVTLNVNEPATTYYTIDGSTPTTSSTKYTNAISINQNTILKYFSIDNSGNKETVKSEKYTMTTSSTTTDEFKSVATEDGYIGQYTADGKSTTVQKLGDKGMYNVDTYRTILSFDSLLPSDATIESAKLRIYRKTLSGNVKSINVDIKSGSFGSTSELEQSDYSATASASGIATLSVPFADDEYTEVALPSSSLKYINRTGKTQIRLSAVTASDFASDALELYGGDSSSFTPVLIVTYK